MSDLAAAAVDEQFVEVLEGKVGEVIADMMGEPSPTPLPTAYGDSTREYCGVWIEPDDVEAEAGHLATHNCDLLPLHTAEHSCGKCSRTWPLSPAERSEALADLERRARELAGKSDADAKEIVDEAIADIDEAMNILDKMAHSKRITDKLLEEPRKVLSPTEVIPSVQRAPELDAIATAVERLVKRMCKEVTTSSTTVWHLELPALETRIATRLEEAGLSPAKALRAAAAIATDVRREADVAEEYIRRRVTETTKADVARNLLPRISKIMKETNDG